MRGWVLTSVSGERSWQSNDGYEDVLGSLYSYDSAVAFHLQVAQNDIVVIRERQAILGISRIDEIDASVGEKLRKRCPVCGRIGVEYRKRTYEYVCTYSGCRSKFPEPAEKLEAVTTYIARYDTCWAALDGALTLGDLEPFLGGSAQNSIRPVDIAGLDGLLSGINASLPGADKPVELHLDGGRRSAQVRARVGKGVFRTALLQRYGLSCAITGPCPAEALEAAHLSPHETPDVEEGLLLRADIHRLFDAGQIAINPNTLAVELVSGLMDYPHYAALLGQKITQTPSVEALRMWYGPATALQPRSD
jgi:hypothetical protein